MSKRAEPVKQNQIIGKSGETGLAAGDHLHFGVYLNGVAVLPIEWWDEKWIRDNVTPKLEGVSGGGRGRAKTITQNSAQTAALIELFSSRFNVFLSFSLNSGPLSLTLNV